MLFLLGRLFDAQGPESTGDDAVVDALTWDGCTTNFTEEQIIPERETVRGTIDELVARAQLRRSMRTQSA